MAGNAGRSGCDRSNQRALTRCRAPFVPQPA
jgi:hypothetical protein